MAKCSGFTEAITIALRRRHTPVSLSTSGRGRPASLSFFLSSSDMLGQEGLSTTGEGAVGVYWRQQKTTSEMTASVQTTFSTPEVKRSLHMDYNMRDHHSLQFLQFPLCPF